MNTVVITNQKGGVGKTTIAALFAWGLAEKESARVALVDLDSQKNLTRTFAQRGCEITAAKLFGPALPALDAAREPLCLFPGVTELADLERASPEIIRNFRNNVMQLASHFDYCLIDTPPALGLRMTAALIVADYVLCPIELEEYSIEGVTAMIKTIIGVRQRHNPRLKFLGLLANRFKSSFGTTARRTGSAFHLIRSTYNPRQDLDPFGHSGSACSRHTGVEASEVLRPGGGL